VLDFPQIEAKTGGRKARSGTRKYIIAIVPVSPG